MEAQRSIAIYLIDEQMKFLEASPDGIIRDDGVVEVKCPSSTENITPKEENENKVRLIGSACCNMLKQSLSITTITYNKPKVLYSWYLNH